MTTMTASLKDIGTEYQRLSRELNEVNQQRKSAAVQAYLEEVPTVTICRDLHMSRTTLMAWLRAEGIEPSG